MIDPVCGMTVDPASAAGSHTHAGETFYFCSHHCLERFKADPQRYLAPSKPDLSTPVKPGNAPRASR